LPAAFKLLETTHLKLLKPLHASTWMNSSAATETKLTKSRSTVEQSLLFLGSSSLHKSGNVWIQSKWGKLLLLLEGSKSSTQLMLALLLLMLMLLLLLHQRLGSKSRRTLEYLLFEGRVSVTETAATSSSRVTHLSIGSI
jgi:hypothetical protein